MTGLVLLSAVEKGKLTRGQSAATILIPQPEIGKLFSLHSELVSVGLGLSDLPDGGIRISSAMALPFISDVAIQVYPITLAGERWITNSNLLGYDEWYEKGELFPTKLYPLGNIDLPGPQNPVPYLKRNFWSLGLGASDKVGVPKKKWYNLSPKIYKRNLPIVRIDEVNGIRLDPRPIPGKQTIIMGNGRPLIVPEVGTTEPLRKGRWRRFLWA